MRTFRTRFPSLGIRSVHFNVDAWCIITVFCVSAFTVNILAILQREMVFPGTVYLDGCREGSQASQLNNAMDKGNFHVILFKTQRFFMLDKCILKIKIHPMRLSGSHGICRI